MTRWSVAAVAVGLVIAGRSASAQTSVSSQYEHGIELRQQRRNDEALAVFQGVYAATHVARALAQVALAEGELGRLVDAEAHLIEALARGDERWIRHNRRSLETALERLRTHLGSLAVGSVVLMVTAPGRDSGRERSGVVGFRCGGGPGTVGVACGGAF